jgi:hypothetical protein
MKLESQTTSLEYSKRLKELNFIIPSYLYWRDIDTPCPRLTAFDVPSDRSGDFWIPAYTPSELMESLPHRITLKEDEPFNSFTLSIRKCFQIKDIKDPINLHMEEIYIINYECDSTECVGEEAWIRRRLTNNITDAKFSDALAKMLIYILENVLNEK